LEAPNLFSAQSPRFGANRNAARKTEACTSTMQAPVATSMWKLMSVPSAAEPEATATAITSILPKRSVSR
jgi:hypothetical protein